ncbi:MAG: type III-A CRISPR-associated RAMP protein Csm3 [Bacteroidota bacterium]
MKLEKKILIQGHILAETGIMVGGSGSAFEIGGTDKQVVRNPINRMPYIPGSSIKGKMRSLLELSEGTIDSSGRGNGPTLNPNHIAAQLFGHIKRPGVQGDTQQPSRVIVRDAELINAEDFEGKTELLYTEIKAENSIDRIDASANPRFFERVPKGAKFGLTIIINVFDEDLNKAEFLSTTLRAMQLVQDDYLGGSGSRGNGQVSFHIASIEERTEDYYKGNSTANKTPTDQIPENLRIKQEENA